MSPALEVTDLTTHIQLTRSVVHAVGNVDVSIDAGQTRRAGRRVGLGQVDARASRSSACCPNGGHIVGGSIKLGDRELVGLKERGDAQAPRRRGRR